MEKDIWLLWNVMVICNARWRWQKFQYFKGKLNGKLEDKMENCKRYDFFFFRILNYEIYHSYHVCNFLLNISTIYTDEKFYS